VLLAEAQRNGDSLAVDTNVRRVVPNTPSPAGKLGPIVRGFPTTGGGGEDVTRATEWKKAIPGRRKR